jgi:hypothetical protein
VEDLPHPGATARNVTNTILKQIIPWVGLVENMKNAMKGLDIDWEYHPFGTFPLQER